MPDDPWSNSPSIAVEKFPPELQEKVRSIPRTVAIEKFWQNAMSFTYCTFDGILLEPGRRSRCLVCNRGFCHLWKKSETRRRIVPFIVLAPSGCLLPRSCTWRTCWSQRKQWGSCWGPSWCSNGLVSRQLMITRNYKSCELSIVLGSKSIVGTRSHVNCQLSIVISNKLVGQASAWLSGRRSVTTTALGAQVRLATS